jgi:hypothetical protein
MKTDRPRDASPIELSIGPHCRRHGWEVARITYDSGRPDHLRQIDAAIEALVHARLAKNLAEAATAGTL